MFHLAIDLSDVDRGVYEKLDLRLARHPSESARYLHARALAYALSYEEGIVFSRGLFAAEEPAIEVRDLRGDRTAWIDIGSPSAERLHKASKSTARVAVFTYAVDALLRNVRAADVHRGDELPVYALEPSFLDEIESLTERNSRWELTRTEGQLYLTMRGKNLASTIETRALASE